MLLNNLMMITYVITVWGSKTVSFFFDSLLFDGKVNLDGTYGRSIFEIPAIVFKNAEINKIIIKEKQEFLRKKVFDKFDFGF